MAYFGIESVNNSHNESTKTPSKNTWRRQAREKARDQLVIAVGFASDWFNKWGEFL